MVTNAITNRTQCKITSLICPMMLPLYHVVNLSILTHSLTYSDLMNNVSVSSSNLGSRDKLDLDIDSFSGLELS